MTVIEAKDRIRKAWDQTIQFFRHVRPQDSKGKKQQEPANSQPDTIWWRKKPLMFTAALLVLLVTVGLGGIQYVKANTVDYYNVYMNGTALGSISNPAEVEQLLKKEAEEVQQANPDITMVLDSGDITYTPESAFKAVPETDATLVKLESMLTSHATGVEVEVDGKVIGIVKDQATADAILTRVQSKYAPQLAVKKKSKEVSTLSYNSTSKSSSDDSAVKDGVIIQDVAFVEKVKTDGVATEPDQIMNADDVYKKLVQGSAQPTKYTVQVGDCIGCIAQKFDISPQVIYDNNRWIEEDKLTAGDVLDLTVLQPELTVKTVEDLTETVAIEAPIEVKKNDSMRVGESKVISKGKNGSKRVTYRIVKQNGYVVTEELVNTEVITKAVASVVMKGTKVVLGEGSGTFAVPVANWSLSSKYGKRWGRTHKGIDITGNKTIMAADDGVIEFAGTKSGYGKTIIINHKNGYKTVYGHMSSLTASVGDIVEKGDKIGVMGSTGRSTGVHLHFEIHKDDVIQNPLKYL
ncbi:MAG: peptidoglycan DD-metalloendopeptidase family protein [Candidatus Pristimantibacillus sp.]